MGNSDTYIQLIALDMTYQCPLRCLHCFNSSGEHGLKRVELSDDEILALIQDMIDMKVGVVSMGGGEALTRKDLVFKIGHKLHDSKARLSPAIVSNGYLLTREVAKELEAANLTNVQISVDGLRENHDRMRNKQGSFGHAVEAIKNLHEEGIKVAVAFSPTKFNIGDLDELFEYLKSIGVTMFRTQPLMLLGRAEKNLKDEFLSYRDYGRIHAFIEKKKKENPKMLVEWGDPLDHLARGTINQERLTFLSISAYGDILVSPYLPIIVGNIRKHSLKEYVENGLPRIWDNPFMQFIGSKMTDVTNMDLKKYELPRIFTEPAIDLDILDKDYEEKTKALVEKYAGK